MAWGWLRIFSIASGQSLLTVYSRNGAPQISTDDACPHGWIVAVLSHLHYNATLASCKVQVAAMPPGSRHATVQPSPGRPSSENVAEDTSAARETLRCRDFASCPSSTLPPTVNSRPDHTGFGQVKPAGTFD